MFYICPSEYSMFAPKVSRLISSYKHCWGNTFLKTLPQPLILQISSQSHCQRKLSHYFEASLVSIFILTLA